MIATSKIAKIKPKMVSVEKYNNDANEILKLYLKNTADRVGIEKYIDKTKEGEKKIFKKRLYVLFSSDKGTCGAINTNIFKETTKIIKDCKSEGSEAIILPIGKKAGQFVKSNSEKLGFDVVETKEPISAEQCNSSVISKIVANIVEAYDKGDFDCVNFVFHKYKNIITCFPISLQLLPFDAKSIGLDGKGIEKSEDFINIEETDGTARSIVEFFVRTKLYNAYISNIASIFSSRMNAMDNATKNGQEIIDELLIKYNKGRQAHITSELSDIVSGFEAIS